MIKKISLLVALCVVTMLAGYAQTAPTIQTMIDEMVKKYETTENVTCFKADKGSGLGMLKLMFNKQFGRDFMRGVTSITIIEYGDASEEVCQALHQDLEAFASLLEEFKDDEKKSSNHSYFRSFGSIEAADRSLSDFIIAIEDEETKMMMHMGGKIIVDK